MNNKLRIVCSIYIFRNDPDIQNFVIIDIYIPRAYRTILKIFVAFIYIYIYYLL